MGRKKKTVSFQLPDDAAKQDKASNASSEMQAGVDKLHPQAKEAMNVGKNSRAGTVVARRSPRIRSLTPSNNSPELKHVPEQVDLVEEEKEQEPEVQSVGNMLVEEEQEQEQEVQPGSNPPDAHGRSLAEKIDYLVEAVDYLKFKIETLIDEQLKLVKKLEFARGKIAAYEEMKVVVGGQKEFVLVSELAKAAGVATASLSPKVDQKSSPSPPPEAVQKSGLPSPSVRKQIGQKRARC
ncbi:hypothetical protein SASPL_111136 [Salvia splendens]|uniref:Uncharacterized protein n=1 Tax=Salvia splendens TaxID=180675 RepID=A0A8X9A327_SALSN|nr:hypothetical protein SASPL_111136 [Salvia splendens]